MNYRKLPFDDLQSADNWLTEALLNRQAASADRLLETTRLTDLIYTGCSFEDVYYGTHRADQPVNAESLAADVFAGLFSPVLRRKDTDNVNLRERLFNNSLRVPSLSKRFPSNRKHKTVKAVTDRRFAPVQHFVFRYCLL